MLLSDLRPIRIFMRLRGWCRLNVFWWTMRFLMHTIENFPVSRTRVWFEPTESEIYKGKSQRLFQCNRVQHSQESDYVKIVTTRCCWLDSTRQSVDKMPSPQTQKEFSFARNSTHPVSTDRPAHIPRRVSWQHKWIVVHRSSVSKCICTRNLNLYIAHPMVSL